MKIEQDFLPARQSSAMDFRGFWEDENGSFLDLSVEGNALSGELGVRGERRRIPLSGVVHGDLISFFVGSDAEALMGFAGQYEACQGAIDLVWISSENPGGGPEAGFIRSGASRFRRVLS